MRKFAKYLLLMTIVGTAEPLMGQNENPLLQDWNTPHQKHSQHCSPDSGADV